MNRLKDFFYNKNDIIIVLIILVVAGLLIYNRIGAIMDYPAKMADKIAATQTTQTLSTTESTTEATTGSEEPDRSDDE
ncbi:MAG: hypothetical protein Q4A40_04610 [Bacillota bacterium]|nr:hypothetical protein [Bacillota bacterium]